MKCRLKYLLLPLAASLPLIVAPAFAVDNLGLFELDWDGPNVADAANNGFGGDGDDWENIADGSDSALATTGIINDTPLSGNDDNVLTGGGTKDDINFDQWKWKTAKPTPDKNNITNAYAAAYAAPDGDLIIYFGADRFANNGDAQIGFWFLQGSVAPVGETQGGFSGTHMEGDILILANFLQGGVVGDVDVFEWCTGCGDSGNNNLIFRGAFDECDGSGADACALNNSGDVPAFWNYTPKFGTPGQIPDNSLFEGGINISELIGPVCLTTFMAETRSSQSTDAVLKDFALEEFTVCDFDATKQCSAAISDGGGGLDIDFSGTVDNTGVGTLFMTVSDDMGDITEVCIDDNAPFGECDAGDTDVGETITDGVATFNLNGGDTARYEGSYTVAAADATINGDGNAEATDTVTVDGRIFEADPEPIKTVMASATCDTPVNGAITVTKDCSADVNAAGDTLLVSVTGSGQNTGDVVLENVTLTDTDPEVEGSLVINGGGATNGAFDLAPGEMFTFTASATEAVLTHSDTITATGSNIFSGSDVSANDDALCNVVATPGVMVTKDCEVSLDFSNAIDTIQLSVGFSGMICNASNVLALTNLTASDSDAGSLTLSQNSLAPSECINYSGSYLPSTTDGGDNPDPSVAAFSDTVTVNADGALGTGPVGDDDDATCELCPTP